MSDNPLFVKKDFCPNCGHKVDSAGCIDREDIKPSPGDYCMCINCAAINTFDDDLNLIKADESKFTEEDIITFNKLKDRWNKMKNMMKG